LLIVAQAPTLTVTLKVSVVLEPAVRLLMVQPSPVLLGAESS